MRPNCVRTCRRIAVSTAPLIRTRAPLISISMVPVGDPAFTPCGTAAAAAAEAETADGPSCGRRQRGTLVPRSRPGAPQVLESLARRGPRRGFDEDRPLRPRPLHHAQAGRP